ncbi:hypothetical protein [Pinibacter aurantiacus]|uniref:DUF2214 family protein n=1 Tax=Pinibacter aurantiacus TaxID=2851599 RepID=A0A9E2SBF0_9BACT|nr:hypothetical protein [Pinibacter aurantiacus]MBV4358329.1 hypothetical protein [Pinibacter aurantiacus]
MQTLYYAALVTHIIGLTILAGSTLMDYLVSKKFWQQLILDRERGVAIQEAMARIPLLMGVSLILLIASGVTMMGITHGVFGEQLWFRIKFGLVVIIILNGMIIGRRQTMKLKKIIASTPSISVADESLIKIRSNLNLFHIIQLTLFVIVFVLSVFKFN